MIKETVKEDKKVRGRVTLERLTQEGCFEKTALQSGAEGGGRSSHAKSCGEGSVDGADTGSEP